MAGVVRIARRDTPQILQGFVQVALLAKGHPQIHLGRQVVRLERQRFPEHRDRLDDVAAGDERGAEIGVGPPVRRVEGDCFSEERDRAGKIRLFRERNAQPVVRFGGSRSNLHRSPERVHCAVVFVAVPIREAQRDMKVGVARVALDGSLELGYGRLRLCPISPPERWELGVVELEVDSNVSSSAPARAATTSCKAALDKTNTRRNVVCLRVIGRAPGVEAAGVSWLRLPSAATSPARAACPPLPSCPSARGADPAGNWLSPTPA